MHEAKNDLNVDPSQPERFLLTRTSRADQSQNRRQFLRIVALSAAGLLTESELGVGIAGAEPNGRLLGLVEFQDEKIAPVGTPIGTELDGRLYTDLSRVSTRRIITPVSEFFVRTRVSRLLSYGGQWQLRVGQSGRLEISSLRAASREMGTHLMECAGNVRLTRFGLISVADWTGVPIDEVLDRARVKSETSWVDISGFDEYAGKSATSVPGASWIFSLETLKASGAFLATGMNGQSLTPDHGAPLRLVVPGWYGCACIKWVNRITLVADEVEATSQMREYAIRTLQQGVPTLARDFAPATIDHAAMPVRVEKWISSGKVSYRVVGIVWGGSVPVKDLRIQFNAEEDFVPVSGFRQIRTDPWTLWTHEWSPKAPGNYSIRLAIADPAVRTRKLDLGMYVRSVEISEV